MDNISGILRYDEQAMMRLRSIYRQFGYEQYRMSRFEEYGLYSENKAFLASGDIITFTGAGGKLMALRPDVTLSIVKNTKDNTETRKLYYNENVYRPDGREFKEQMQVGLECIGNIDIYSMGEVIMLARRSLLTLGKRTCLDVSHMGFINGLLSSTELSPAQTSELLQRISEKNIPELTAICTKYSLSDTYRDRIIALSSIYGPYTGALSELQRLNINEETDAALRELEDIKSVLQGFGLAEDVNLDFSIVNDLSYYSGVIFQGYIEGVPTKVLSGGRYDKLLRKFGKRCGAVGFAVYLDLLERLAPPRQGTHVDVLLLYTDEADPQDVVNAVREITESGQSVRVTHKDDGTVKYKKLCKM